MLLWAQGGVPIAVDGAVPIAVDALAPATRSLRTPVAPTLAQEHSSTPAIRYAKKNATTMRRVAALIVGALAGANAFQAPRQTAARAAPLQSIKINTRSGESVDSVIMRLRREVNKSGHLRTLRHKRFHEDAREKKKRKVAEARRKMKFMRQRKRRSQQQGP